MVGHLEDVSETCRGTKYQKPEEWLESRKIHNWWRCSKCLWRNEDTWTCSRCQHLCEPFRQILRTTNIFQTKDTKKAREGTERLPYYVATTAQQSTSIDVQVQPLSQDGTKGIHHNISPGSTSSLWTLYQHSSTRQSQMDGPPLTQFPPSFSGEPVNNPSLTQVDYSQPIALSLHGSRHTQATEQNINSDNKRHLCHCGNRFSRASDLKRHQKLHNPTEQKYPCDWPKCKNQYRLDHLREHYRNYHQEDLPRSVKGVAREEPEEWLKSRKVHRWWRCTYCLCRNEKNWTCELCKKLCETFRQKIRDKTT